MACVLVHCKGWHGGNGSRVRILLPDGQRQQHSTFDLANKKNLWSCALCACSRKHAKKKRDRGLVPSGCDSQPAMSSSAMQGHRKTALEALSTLAFLAYLPSNFFSKHYLHTLQLHYEIRTCPLRRCTCEAKRVRKTKSGTLT